MAFENQGFRTYIGILTNHYVVQRFVRALSVMLNDRVAMIYFTYILFVFFLGAFGPYLAPYPYNETMYGPNGDILLSASPSMAHPLGTTNVGYDVLSRLLYGARPTLIAGVFGGSLIVGIGVTVGLVSGYVGGRIENVLMRITDVMYGLPLLPTAIVLSAFFGVGFFKATLILGLVLWRATARVIRSQVLQIKERPFILASKTTGASTPYLIVKHVFPNVLPMVILFFANGMGKVILLQASLSFLGITSPFIPSWGVMIRNAFKAGEVADSIWWSIPPGLLISLTVLSLFMFGRRYEELITGRETDEGILG